MWESRAVILLYHRIASPSIDSMALSVSPENFREQLEALREHRILSLADLAASVESGTVEQGSVAITFDDGYTDNLLSGIPALVEHGAPATFFIASGHTDSLKPFWWDRLEAQLLRTGVTADDVEIEISGERRKFELDPLWRSSKSADTWTVESTSDPSKSHTALKEIHAFLRNRTPERIEEALKQLEAVSADAGCETAPESLPLTDTQLIELASAPGAEIGAHTVSHPVLSAQSEERQRREIKQGKARLEEILGKPVDYLAYPFGTQSDYDEVSMRIAREAGFTAACANFPRPVTKKSNLFALPRMVVRNWDGDEFARELNRFFRS